MPSYDVNVRAIIRHPSSWKVEISPKWEVYNAEDRNGKSVVSCDTTVRFVEAADEAEAMELAKDKAPWPLRPRATGMRRSSSGVTGTST